MTGIWRPALARGARVRRSVPAHEAATDALTHADPGWLAGLVTRRVALDSWTDALERDAEDVKVIVDLV